jgi:lysophospholipid acyltransferase (LPLAT)-like uncharacterized protein
MLKRLGRSAAVQSLVGALAVAWLRLVRATTRFVVEPEGFPEATRREEPVIVAMWHGQHFMVSYAWPKGMRVSALISRSGDGELNARALERLGVEPIRGSGGSRRKTRKRGGAEALRAMVKRLREGSSVVLTADVPKVARVCGEGIVTLARLSGRPIFPIAVVCGRRIDFSSWDRASIGLPFGRGAMVLGQPVRVDANASPEDIERARLAVEDGLNEAHRRAYQLVDARDPGAGLIRAREMSA